MDIEKKHSRLGIASFVISIISGLFIVALIAVVGFLTAASPEGIDDESMGALFLGLVFFGTLAGVFLAFILGVAGLFARERKKLFAVLGTVLSALILACMTILTILGATMSSAV